MRPSIAVLLAYGISVWFADAVRAGDGMPTIAVFTKNCTNPAYAAFRIAAEQIGRTNGVRIRRFVPKRPDTVDEQTACHAEADAQLA
jgi:ribose transport system substrate-binding protein